MNEAELREQMAAVCRRMYERDLVGATEGNVSCRVSAAALLSTPGGVCKGDLRPEDMVLTDAYGTPVQGGRPSSELKVHLAAYRARPDISAVVHAHPLTATALTLNLDTIPSGMLPEAVVILGDVALVPFAMPGSQELADAAMARMEKHNTLMLASHGAVTLGTSLWDAFWRMETLERVARVYAIAEKRGEVLTLPASALQKLRQMAQS